VLVADEPTTALDVTIQAQILALLRRLADSHGMAMILITHNFGVIASVCDRVIVMYAGQTVEEGTIDAALARPDHPYTKGLLQSLPERSSGTRLPAVPGSPPQLEALPAGCRFRDRCAYAEEICVQPPALLPLPSGGLSRCWVAQREGHLPTVSPPPASTPAVCGALR
jgi:oligopeptide/dipeptide ABC transporter ATP-binding protein